MHPARLSIRESRHMLGSCTLRLRYGPEWDAGLSEMGSVPILRWRDFLYFSTARLERWFGFCARELGCVVQPTGIIHSNRFRSGALDRDYFPFRPRGYMYPLVLICVARYITFLTTAIGKKVHGYLTATYATRHVSDELVSSSDNFKFETTFCFWHC